MKIKIIKTQVYFGFQEDETFNIHEDKVNKTIKDLRKDTFTLNHIYMISETSNKRLVTIVNYEDLNGEITL